MIQSIPFKFHGRKETMDIINTGGDLVGYLSNQSVECPLIGSNIKLIKKLGQGNYGAAFLVKIEGMGEKKYVAKRSRAYGEVIPVKVPEGGRTLRQLAMQLQQKKLIAAETVIALNGGDDNRILNEGKVYIYLPVYANICKTEHTMFIPRLDGQDKLRIPKGSYVCEEVQYSEYVIGLLCGDIYRRGISINFVDVFGFATCPDKSIEEHREEILTDPPKMNDFFVDQYVFMEKIDTPLRKIRKCAFDGNKRTAVMKSLSENVKNAKTSRETRKAIEERNKEKGKAIMAEVLLVQVLHAIRCYQKMYKIQHNDLHDDNVFIEYVRPGTVFNGQDIYEADWFHYHIDGTDLYLPSIPMLVKIGDFGLSVKYSEPVVGNYTSLTTGYDQEDGKGPWIPNWYAPNSDMIFIAHSFWTENRNDKFITDIFKKMLGLNPSDSTYEIIDLMRNGYLAGGFTRPKMDYISGKFSGASPETLLTDKNLMKKYLKKPKSGNIVTLGVI